MMRIYDLDNKQLNFWTAMAQDWKSLDSPLAWLDENNVYVHKNYYLPTTNWIQCGALIKKYNINIGTDPLGGRVAYLIDGEIDADDDDVMRAVCLLVVMLKYGNEVDE